VAGQVGFEPTISASIAKVLPLGFAVYNL